MPHIDDFCCIPTLKKTRCKFPVTAIRNGKTYCTRHDPLLKKYHEEAMFRAADLIRELVKEELKNAIKDVMKELKTPVEDWKKEVSFREVVLRTVLASIRVDGLCPSSCETAKKDSGTIITDCLECKYGNGIVDELAGQSDARGRPIFSALN